MLSAIRALAGTGRGVHLGRGNGDVDHVKVLLQPMANKGAASVDQVPQLQISLLVRRQMPASTSSILTAAMLLQPDTRAAAYCKVHELASAASVDTCLPGGKAQPG